MTLAEYLYSVFWKFVVGYVWYRSLLFRPLAGLERKASLHIAGVRRNTTTASRSIWRRTDVTTANAEQNR